MTATPGAGSSAQFLWRYGQLGLSAMLGVSLLLLLAVTLAAPHLLPFFPILIAGVTVLWYLYRNPLIHLVAVLASFVLIADFEEGIDLGEILFALFYSTYLATWLFRQVFLHQERLFPSTTDRLVATILVGVGFYVVVGVIMGAEIGDALREAQAWTMIAFYFPVKDACRRYPRGLHLILGVVAFAALFVSIRNVVQLQSLLSAATEAWQITKKGRVIANEVLLVSGGLVALVTTFYFKRFLSLAGNALLLVIFLLGIILTQSRGYWLGFAFGTFAIFLLADSANRKKMITLATSSLTVGLVVAFVLFGDFAKLLFAGLFDRVLSLGSTTSDLSLVNRFLEIQGAWESIRVNPILGYGFGRDFTFFDLTIAGTRRWSFIHNGYVGLWYKFGLPGTAIVLTFWIRSIVRGTRFVRQFGIESWAAKGCLISVGIFVSFLLSAMTANPFYLSDTLLIFGIFGGINAAITDPRPVAKALQ